MTEKTNVTRLPVRPRPRMVRHRGPLERLRGATADLRECIGESTVDLDGLREIARRLDAVAAQLEDR